MPKQKPPPDPIEDPHGVFDRILALYYASPTDWHALAKVLEELGWKIDRSAPLPDVLARKQFRPGPGMTAFLPQAVWMELGFCVGSKTAADFIQVRQEAATKLNAPPSDPKGN